MDRPVNEHQVGILALEPLDCPGTSMRRTVVDDPENPSRPAIGMLSHDLIDQAITTRKNDVWAPKLVSGFFVRASRPAFRYTSHGKSSHRNTKAACLDRTKARGF